MSGRPKGRSRSRNVGYREIFQAGEALGGAFVVDRQHPHDFNMQLAVSWRLGVTDRTAVFKHARSRSTCFL
jgi:hypothetical protein